ncbi:MAG: hypothetical protein RR716_06500, partial [Christensenellaceae bacterium]
MKRMIAIGMAFLLALVCTTTVFAASETLEVPDLHMAVTIPNADELAIAVANGEYNVIMKEA